MKFIAFQRSKISNKDLDFIASLIKNKYKPIDARYNYNAIKKLDKLAKIFQVSSYEEITRKALFYKLIDIKMSNEYLNYINNYSKNRHKIVNKFRKDFIKLALNAPDKISDFCINWNGETKLLKQFLNTIKSDRQINKYIKTAHKLWLKYLIETRCEYRNMLFQLFNSEKEYEQKVFVLANETCYFVLECIYLTKNFITNNFPITIKRIYTKEEKQLIKFLLFKGDEIEYMKKYNISFEELEKLYSSICENFNCSTINQALSLIIIEKYIRNQNLLHISLLLNIQSLNVKTGFLNEIIGDIDKNTLNDKKKLFKKITLSKCNLLES